MEQNLITPERFKSQMRNLIKKQRENYIDQLVRESRDLNHKVLNELESIERNLEAQAAKSLKLKKFCQENEEHLFRRYPHFKQMVINYRFQRQKEKIYPINKNSSENGSPNEHQNHQHSQIMKSRVNSKNLNPDIADSTLEDMRNIHPNFFSTPNVANLPGASKSLINSSGKHLKFRSPENSVHIDYNDHLNSDDTMSQNDDTAIPRSKIISIDTKKDDPVNRSPKTVIKNNNIYINAQNGEFVSNSDKMVSHNHLANCISSPDYSSKQSSSQDFKDSSKQFTENHYHTLHDNSSHAKNEKASLAKSDLSSSAQPPSPTPPPRRRRGSSRSTATVSSTKSPFSVDHIDSPKMPIMVVPKETKPPSDELENHSDSNVQNRKDHFEIPSNEENTVHSHSMSESSHHSYVDPSVSRRRSTMLDYSNSGSSSTLSDLDDNIDGGVITAERLRALNSIRRRSSGGNSTGPMVRDLTFSNSQNTNENSKASNINAAIISTNGDKLDNKITSTDQTTESVSSTVDTSDVEEIDVSQPNINDAYKRMLGVQAQSSTKQTMAVDDFESDESDLIGYTPRLSEPITRSNNIGKNDLNEIQSESSKEAPQISPLPTDRSGRSHEPSSNVATNRDVKLASVSDSIVINNSNTTADLIRRRALGFDSSDDEDDYGALGRRSYQTNMKVDKDDGDDF